jgi:ankyrin repeat protein
MNDYECVCLVDTWCCTIEKKGLTGIAHMIDTDQDVLKRQDKLGRSLAHELCLCKLDGSCDLFVHFIKMRGIEILFLGDNEGFLPSHMAAREGNLKLCSEIHLRAPTSLTKKSREGRTPLHFAAQHGHSEICSESYMYM